MPGIGTKYHRHLRQRILKQHEQLPSPYVKIRTLDQLVLLMSVVSPLMTVPQVLNVWLYQNVAGVSALTFGTYLFACSVWLAYGILHRELRIVALNSLLVICNGLIFSGTLYYA